MIAFERDTSMEGQNRFHRYYQVIKYEGGNRYIPSFNKYTRKHTCCIYKQFKDIKSWVFWCSDNGGSNATYCDSISIWRMQAKLFCKGEL